MYNIAWVCQFINRSANFIQFNLTYYFLFFQVSHGSGDAVRDCTHISCVSECFYYLC